MLAFPCGRMVALATPAPNILATDRNVRKSSWVDRPDRVDSRDEQTSFLQVLNAEWQFVGEDGESVHPAAMQVVRSRASAIAIASPSQARDITETPAALFFTRDETPGIQMIRPETTRFDDQGDPIPGSSCCDQPLFGPPPAFAPEPPIGPDGVIDTSLLWLQQDDFSESSQTQFKELGLTIGQEANRPRLRPFMASWLYDTEEQSFTIADRMLGPMLAERPHTMGKGRMAIGWSYQQVNWTSLDGNDLDSLQFRIDHKDVNGDGVLTGQETDYIIVDLDMKLEQDYVDFYFEYGLTNNFDVAIVVPIVQTNLEMTAQAGLIQQATPGSGVDLTEPGLDFAYRFDPNAPAANGDQWGIYHSRRNHQFCRQDLNETFISLNRSDNSTGCPGGSDEQAKGDSASTFFGGIRDIKDEKAIGLGDIRFRAKWHALTSGPDTLMPDLAWVAEIRPPTGVEDDLHGTGALSTSNYLVGSWTPPELPESIDWFSGFRPHMNVGIDISTGPDWQDATEWAFGVELPAPNLLTLVTRGHLRGVDWLSLSFDQLGRVPFGNEVARRYEYGGGLKLVPTPGSALYFDFIKPINEDDGLTADFSWRVGGQILF